MGNRENRQFRIHQSLVTLRDSCRVHLTVDEVINGKKATGKRAVGNGSHRGLTYAKNPYWRSELVSFPWYRKTSSTFLPNMRAILKAKSKPGSYLPVSTALMHCRVTPTASARSACDHSFSALKTRSRVFILDTAKTRELGRCSTTQSSMPGSRARLWKEIRISEGGRQQA